MSVRPAMFFHLLRRGLLGRGSRPVIALLGLTVASAMITAMLSLYTGLENKLNRDFRSYGANITLAAPENGSLSLDAVTKAEASVPSGSLVVPFAFAIAHTQHRDAIVVAGVDMDRVRQLNPWWLVSKWPDGDHQALLGNKAASKVGTENGLIELNFSDRPLQLQSVGTLKTGAEEEDRIYIPLRTFTAWTSVQPSLLEISVPGSASDVGTAITHLQTALPEAQVRPVHQLMQAEGAVITKMSSVMLASTILITFTVALCVFSTLTSSVLERRRDFAVMKAIGSSQTMVNALFAGEALSIAVIAAFTGFFCGSILAAWIAKSNFHSTVLPQFQVLPETILASVMLALIAAMLPLLRLQRIEPAGILKGE
jgi:putative ABC transport system permease protein